MSVCHRPALLLLLLWVHLGLMAQPVPAVDENIPALVTFGKDADTAWGDDDFIQIIFFSIPETFQDPIFIRVYDPDTGGAFDEQQGAWNTRANFSVFGAAKQIIS